MKKQTKTEKIKLLSTNHKDWFLNRSTSNKNHKTQRCNREHLNQEQVRRDPPPPNLPTKWNYWILLLYYYNIRPWKPSCMNHMKWSWNHPTRKNDFSYREKARTKLKNICSLQLQRRWRIWRRDKPVTTRTTAIELGTHTAITWLNIKLEHILINRRKKNKSKKTQTCKIHKSKSTKNLKT